MQLVWSEDQKKWRYHCDRCGWDSEWVHRHIGPVLKAQRVMGSVDTHSCVLWLIEEGEGQRVARD